MIFSCVKNGIITKIKNDIDKINTRLITLQNQFLDVCITPQDYHTVNQRVEKDLTGLELRLKDLKEDKLPYKEYINQTVPMLENIVEYYRKSDGETKKKILGCIFSKKIVLEKGKVATCEFITPVQVLFNASKVFEGFNIKKEVKTSPKHRASFIEYH